MLVIFLGHGNIWQSFAHKGDDPLPLPLPLLETVETLPNSPLTRPTACLPKQLKREWRVGESWKQSASSVLAM